MNTSAESRLWLAVHLLYPSASQAFEVYQGIILQSEKAISQNDRSFIFSKLVLAFDKITPISSSLSFYEFELEEIDQWKLIYKTSQKIQQIIFIGFLIFELKTSEVASLVKLTEEKTQFLFHQMFKKLVQNSSKIKYAENIDLKKQNDFRVSYLYTYENLIPYCFEQLSDKDGAKVRLGLELYPVLQTTRDEYLKVIKQIQNLKVQRSNSELLNQKSATNLKVVKSVEETKPPGTKLSFKEKWFKENKTMTIGILSSFFLVTLILSQYRTFVDTVLGTNNAIIIREVERPVIVSKGDEVATDSIPVAAEPKDENSNRTSSEQKQAVPINNESQKNTLISDHNKKTTKPVDSTPKGGLYRGIVYVKNLKEVNTQIISKLVSLGAKKAGEVELGWLKTKDTAYYHFTMPEPKIEEVESYLKKMGQVEIKFENHPRLIPAGSKRFIVEVRE